MGKLDELFGIVEREDKKSDLERIETIEELVSSEEFQRAISELERVKKDENIYVGAEIIIKGLSKPDLLTDRASISAYLKELIPIINGVNSWRYRAILMADVAMAFYEIGDEFNGDLALKTAINLAYAAGEDVLVEILRELIRRGMLDKGSYAFSLVRDRKKIDFLLSQLVEFFYLAGDYEKARAALHHIQDPFHRSVALYRLALIESSRDKNKALVLLEEATKSAEKIQNKHARLELLIKLSDLKGQLTGEGVSLKEILKKNSSPPSSQHGENAHDEDQY
ncbi:hypothetical protein A3L09_08380 [Thermococcus profundus]|uniref:Uncharacterized protein n=1 Tax=Thermococcus profundus TaxID=49899 RepID=A0A2Z2MMW4_THEPR|nr:hypothetical protein [Thermococcus profundus]ASJ03268.1 hypothetical protein A3L09_08380 [Thermococcus profundus]